MTDVIKKIYAAINSNEIAHMRELFDPQIERVEPVGFPTSGTYRGRTDVLAHLLTGRATWEEGSCEPEEFIEAGNRVVANLHVRVRLKNQTEWIDSRMADAFVCREGRVVEWRSFAAREDALAWLNAKT